MPRLIKFFRASYPNDPDYINPQHIRFINFGHIATIYLAGGTEIDVTVAEGYRLVAEINGDPQDSPTEERLKAQAAEEVEAENKAYAPPARDMDDVPF